MLLRTLFILFFACTSTLGLTLMAKPEVGAPQSELKRTQVVIQTARGDVSLQPEVATTPLEQEIGLMGRTRAGSRAGMYFPLPRPGTVEVDTSGVGFPVDILFVSPDGRIAKIEKMARAGSSGEFKSPGSVGAYLQIEGGKARKLGIRAGDMLREG
jgi:uncharacterized membrane protein (UPF0127 family)